MSESYYNYRFYIEFQLRIGKTLYYLSKVSISGKIIFDLKDISPGDRIETIKTTCTKDVLKYAMNRLDDALCHSQYLKNISAKTRMFTADDFYKRWGEGDVDLKLVYIEYLDERR